MIKARVARELIQKYIFIPPNGTRYNNFHVESFGDTYIIVNDTWKFFVCIGKELKGYKNDIIYVTYDGEKHGTGDYTLNSDRHGVICKFKERTEEK